MFCKIGTSFGAVKFSKPCQPQMILDKPIDSDWSDPFINNLEKVYIKIEYQDNMVLLKHIAEKHFECDVQDNRYSKPFFLLC